MDTWDHRKHYKRKEDSTVQRKLPIKKKRASRDLDMFPLKCSMKYLYRLKLSSKSQKLLISRTATSPMAQ